MKSFLWHLGKFFQLAALICAPYAIYIGMSTENAKMELQILLTSVTFFLVGLLLVKATSRA
jgi:hypothetical protein